MQQKSIENFECLFISFMAKTHKPFLLSFQGIKIENPTS